MIDQIIIVVYLLLTLVLGMWAGRNVKDVSDFSIASKSYNTPIITATLLATMIGGGHTIGIAARTYDVGIIYVVATFFGAIFTNLIVARFIAPNIAKFKDFRTIGDLLEEFYGDNTKVFGGMIGAIYSLGTVAAQILAMGAFISVIMEIEPWFAILITGTIVTIYSSFGGARAVAITDVFQFCILVIIIPLVCNVAVNYIGGVNELLEKVPVQKFEVFDHPDFYNYLALFILFFM